MNAKPEMVELHQSPLLSGDQILRFSTQDVEFSVPLYAVKHVLPLVALQVIPGSPDYLVGLMNFHGTSLPVIDMAIQLGTPQTERYTPDDAIVLCEHGAKQIGILATHITGIESVTEQQLQMQSDARNASPLFLAVINTPQGTSLLLDIEHVAMSVGLGQSSNGHQLNAINVDRAPSGAK